MIRQPIYNVWCTTYLNTAIVPCCVEVYNNYKINNKNIDLIPQTNTTPLTVPDEQYSGHQIITNYNCGKKP